MPKYLICLFEGYLKDGKRRIKIKVFTMEINTGGVPQGSHLGPLYFLLCILTIWLISKKYSHHLLFADDLKLSPSE